VSLGGGDPSRYTAQVEALKLEANVFFMGAQPNPLDWISSFDVATLCSESEGFSNAIVEYLMCGIPVVCSRVGGNPEIVKDGYNGYLFECGDTTSLATHLIELCTNPQHYQQVSMSAKSSIDERFTIPFFVNEHIELYEGVQ
jgi:glycosyltransferase involved in cell wall biosynthesis